MPTPHSPFPPENQSQQGAGPTGDQASDDPTSATGKSAITSSTSQQNIEHLTREIVHELISKRIRLLTNWDAVNKLINDRVKNFVDRDSLHEIISRRIENLIDRPVVHKLITDRIAPLIERQSVQRLLSERLASTVDQKTVHEIIDNRLAEPPTSERSGTSWVPRLRGTPPANTVDRQTVHEIINKRMVNSQRPVSWEDDISANTLDEEPFETLGSPKSREIDLFIQAAAGHGDRETLATVDIAQLVAKDDIPIPTPPDRERYFPGYDEKYWLFGLADYLKVMQQAAKYNLQPNSVLDFGCASGRVLRHFAAQTDIKDVWGSDINRRHIRWLYEHMPMNVRPVFNHCIPSLPIPDASIDVITAFSVFTHIDTFEIHWLAELSRILSDDGLCYLTVHNENTWESLMEDKNNPDNRLVQSLVRIDPEIAEQLNGPMPGDRLVYRFTKQGPYRAQVFLSNKHLERVWGRFFSIQEIIPRHHQRQTVVVLKKRR